MTARKRWVIAGVTAMLLAAVSAQATSHVRIVRLSYTDGNVKIERAAGHGLERAMLNSPIVEGTRIVTGGDGLAEVEFENNSAVRLGEASEVRFRQLLINDAADKVNEVELVRGSMYFDTHSGKGDINRVIAADRTFVLRHDSEVRFVMSGDQVQAAVFKGEAQLDNNSQFVRISKNDTLTVDATNPAGFVIAKGVDRLPLDSWSNERAAYQTAYSYNNNGYGSSKLSVFGYQDLAYYGGFMNVPGYGLAWQPYGISNWMGWDPYMSGAWAFTPGFGYAWASAYPWGWMPYHYGSWAFLDGTGWFWYPGNAFNNGGAVMNWQATTPVIKGPPGYAAPVAPVVPTGAPRPAIVVGVIGRAPAYIPGGPVPPNFSGVITDHSGLVGMNAPFSGAVGSSATAHKSRAANLAGSNATPATGSSFAASRQQTANVSGHVFVAPAPSWTSTGYGYSLPGSSNWGNGTSAQGSTGMSRAVTGHSGSSTVHK